MISALQQLQQLLHQFNPMYLHLCLLIRLFLYVMQNTWKGWEGEKADTAGVAVARTTAEVAEKNFIFNNY